MRLRTATEADAAAIAAIWNHVIRDTEITFNSVEKTPREIAALIDEKAGTALPFLVTEDEAGPVGFATYGQFRGGAGYARTMEHTVILAPGATGRGTGRRLMAALEDHARARGVHSMWAGISAGNPGAIAFHTAIGYAHAATLPEVGWKFGRFHDLVLMRKTL